MGGRIIVIDFKIIAHRIKHLHSYTHCSPYNCEGVRVCTRSGRRGRGCLVKGGPNGDREVGR